MPAKLVAALADRSPCFVVWLQTFARVEFGGQVKWVVTFAGGRDQYQVPLALAEAGMLETLVTDWYSPLDQWPWRYLQRAVPRADQYLRRRYREGLPSALVKRNLAAIMKLKLQGSQSSDRALGDTAAQVARNRHTGLL